MLEARVGAALGDERQGVAAGPGDFEVLGQCLLQRYVAEGVDVHVGVATQAGEFKQFADQFRAVARHHAKRVTGFIAQAGVGKVQGELAGFLVQAVRVQVPIKQQA